MKPHVGHMELAVVDLINPRIHDIVPNVSWGLGLKHECDLLVLDRKNRFTEIEIKTTKSDLIADFKKPHGHSSAIISRLVYAVPDDILDTAIEVVPQNCGIVVVRYCKYVGKFKASWHRQCKHRKLREPINPNLIKKFYELGLMRIWTLKSKLVYK